MINITNVISTTYHYYGLYIHQYVYIGYTYMFLYVFICLDDDPTNPCLTGWWSRLQFLLKRPGMPGPPPGGQGGSCFGVSAGDP